MCEKPLIHCFYIGLKAWIEFGFTNVLHTYRNAQRSCRILKINIWVSTPVDVHFSSNCRSGIVVQYIWTQVIGANIECRYDCLVMLHACTACCLCSFCDRTWLLCNDSCWYVSAPVPLRQIRDCLLYVLDKVNLGMWKGKAKISSASGWAFRLCTKHWSS